VNRLHSLGTRGEQTAAEHLRRQRYAILERNYSCKLGEVDLIALDGRTVVFVEVKSRTGEGYGTPFDAVTRRKRRQITRVAQYYVLQHRLADRDVRFDVVGIWWEDGAPRCELIRNAFEAELTPRPRRR
jgi:putative endonuclease